MIPRQGRNEGVKNDRYLEVSFVSLASLINNSRVRLVCWHTLIIPGFERWRREDQESFS